MKFKTINLETLLDPVENPAYCLSPLRVFNECHKCSVFKLAKGDQDNLACKPRVTKRVKILMGKKRRLLEKLRTINQELGLK